MCYSLCMVTKSTTTKAKTKTTKKSAPKKVPAKATAKSTSKPVAAKPVKLLKTTKSTSSKSATAGIKGLRLKASALTPASLRGWNIILAALFALQAVLILALSNGNWLPVTTSYLTVDTLASQASGTTELTGAVHRLFDVNLAYVVAAFLLVAAATHLIAATVYRRGYEANLARGVNKARWIGLGISAGLMMTTIALVSGVRDLSSLKMLFSLVFVMSLLGLATEIYGHFNGRRNWLTFGIASYAGVIAWAVVGKYLLDANLFGDVTLPAYIYAVYGVALALWIIAAYNTFLQHKGQGKWANYLFGERLHMLVGFVALTALAWQVFLGALK